MSHSPEYYRIFRIVTFSRSADKTYYLQTTVTRGILPENKMYIIFFYFIYIHLYEYINLCLLPKNFEIKKNEIG